MLELVSFSLDRRCRCGLQGMSRSLVTVPACVQLAGDGKERPATAYPCHEVSSLPPNVEPGYSVHGSRAWVPNLVLRQLGVTS